MIFLRCFVKFSDFSLLVLGQAQADEAAVPDAQAMGLIHIFHVTCHGRSMTWMISCMSMSCQVKSENLGAKSAWEARDPVMFAAEGLSGLCKKAF